MLPRTRRVRCGTPAGGGERALSGGRSRAARRMPAAGSGDGRCLALGRLRRISSRTPARPRHPVAPSPGSAVARARGSPRRVEPMRLRRAPSGAALTEVRTAPVCSQVVSPYSMAYRRPRAGIHDLVDAAVGGTAAGAGRATSEASLLGVGDSAGDQLTGNTVGHLRQGRSSGEFSGWCEWWRRRCRSSSAEAVGDSSKASPDSRGNVGELRSDRCRDMFCIGPSFSVICDIADKRKNIPNPRLPVHPLFRV